LDGPAGTIPAPLGPQSKYGIDDYAGWNKEVTMGVLSWIVMGLVVGVLAKIIMPGKDPGGFIVTICLGIVGAFVGGYLGSLLGFGAVTGFNLHSLLIAIGGAIVLLIAYRILRR
jgi:uncharacterized membrane protein YeaQ/YmgE (transglycosylase-associated protein family)